MKGIINFRDYGVYETTDGKKMKSGKLFRAANLGKASQEEMQWLKDLGIGTIMDLREDFEVEKSPDPIIEGIEYVQVPASSLDMKEIKHDNHGAQEGFDRNRMIQIYQELPLGNKAYARFFDVLLHTDKGVIHHCTAGKDRAGVAAALVLLLLGVSREDALNDYLKTNDNIRDIVANIMGSDSEEVYNQIMATMGDAFVVDEDYFNAAMDVILEKYDSFEEFFLNEYGITEEMRGEFRNKYLEG